MTQHIFSCFFEFFQRLKHQSLLPPIVLLHSLSTPIVRVYDLSQDEVDSDEWANEDEWDEIDIG